MVVIPSTSYMHGIANLSMEERRHIAVRFVGAKSNGCRQEDASEFEKRETDDGKEWSGVE